MGTVGLSRKGRGGGGGQRQKHALVPAANWRFLRYKVLLLHYLLCPSCRGSQGEEQDLAPAAKAGGILRRSGHRNRQRPVGRHRHHRRRIHHLGRRFERHESSLATGHRCGLSHHRVRPACVGCRCALGLRRFQSCLRLRLLQPRRQLRNLQVREGEVCKPCRVCVGTCDQSNDWSNPAICSG